MRKLSWSTAVIVLVMLLVPLEVWSAVGNVSVTVATGPNRRPVPGVKVRVGDQVTTTDAQGRAELRIEEGSRTLELDHPEFSSTTSAITVGPGQTTRADVTLNPIFPFNVQNPPGGLGGFTVGALGLFQRDDLSIDREVETFLINGNRVTGRENFSPNAFRLRVNGGGVDGAIGLPRFPLFGWEFSPAVSGMVGGADVELENTVNDFRLSGPGWFAGGGVELAAVPSSLPQMHLALGWQGTWMKASDLDSRIAGRDICSVVFPTGQNCRNRSDLSAVTHDLYVRGGYSFWQNRVGPFVGLKVRWSDVEVTSDTRAIFSGNEVRDQLDLDFQRGRCPAVLGLAGVDVRGPDVGSLGRVFGRLQTEFSGSSLSVLFKLMYALGR